MLSAREVARSVLTALTALTALTTPTALRFYRFVTWLPEKARKQRIQPVSATRTSSTRPGYRRQLAALPVLRKSGQQDREGFVR